MDLANLFGSRFVRGFSSNCFDREVYKSLEDSIDRWSYLYSFTIISFLAFVSTANVYFFKAFECTPLVTNLEQINILGYIHAYCWSMGTTALKINESMPISSEEWDKAAEVGKISFYQWVPFCLALQAILFLIPHIVWDALASRMFGDDMNAILESASRCIHDLDARERKVNAVNCAKKIINLSQVQGDDRESIKARFQRWSSSKVPCGRVLCCSKRLGNWITFYYILTKCLYIGNLVGQIFIIKYFLSHGRNDPLRSGSVYDFALSLFGSLLSLDEWEGGGSVFFPRKTYCMVDFKHLGVDSNRYLSVCALPVNIYSEKMYVFLWCWLCLVLTLTVMSLVAWMVCSFFARSQENFVFSLLKDWQGQAENYKITHDLFRYYVKYFLRSDGVFILRMIKKNSGSLIAQEICLETWKIAMEIIQTKKKLEDSPDTIERGFV